MLLGFQEHDIAPLMAAKLLVPLGKPAPNAPNDFAVTDIAVRSIELRLAVVCYETAGETLAAQEPAKGPESCLLSMTYTPSMLAAPEGFY